uniref:Uncharacterized protein n=1 Tax=Vitrella brassicaformis TaxID=1169539 RepID=A0A7S1JVP1_9ALVE
MSVLLFHTRLLTREGERERERNTPAFLKRLFRGVGDSADRLSWVGCFIQCTQLAALDGSTDTRHVWGTFVRARNTCVLYFCLCLSNQPFLPTEKEDEDRGAAI